MVDAINVSDVLLKPSKLCGRLGDGAEYPASLDDDAKYYRMRAGPESEGYVGTTVKDAAAIVSAIYKDHSTSWLTGFRSFGGQCLWRGAVIIVAT